MKTSINVKLGTTTNLLYGYNASWLNESSGNNALIPVPIKVLKEVDGELPSETAQWSFPFVSLHETPESLLDALLPYQVQNPSDGTVEPGLPAGTLLIGNNFTRESAIRELSTTLGVDLGNSKNAYALVQLKRVDADAAHPVNQMGVLVHPNPTKIPDEFGVSTEYQKAMASLKRVKPRGAAFSPENVSMEDANGYLEFFSQKGTHFVSNMTFGDVIFQVFALPRESSFEKVKKIYAQQQGMLTGTDAILFRQYTTNGNSGAYGYVSEYGKILSFSQSSLLKQSVADGKWVENTFALTSSIFSLYQNDAKVTTATLNADYTDITTIMTDLTTLTLFAEHSRKQVWRRIFIGGLIQIYRGAIKPHFEAGSFIELARSFQQNELPGLLSNIATPVVNTYKTSLDLADLSFVAPDVVNQFTLYSNILYNSKPQAIQIPGNDVLICVQQISLETQEYTSVIQVNDSVFDTFGLSCSSFYGALMIENASKTKHYTLVDGLKYVNAKNESGDRDYVTVTASVCNAPDSVNLGRLKSSLQFNYSFAESCLPTLSPDSDPMKASFLNESLEWISEIIPADTTDVDLLDLRLRALDQAYVKGDATMGAFVPLLPYAEYQQQITGILDYIKEIDDTIDRYHTDIQFRKTQELVIDVAKDLNKNIIDSGKLLSGYVNASLVQQQQLAIYYDSIIKQKQIEKKQSENSITQLLLQMNSQQAMVQTASKNYEQSLQDWKITEEIKFGLTVATTLFSLGTTIAVPASSISAVKDLGYMVQCIQKFLNIINATYKVFTETKASIDKLTDAQKTFDGLSGVLSANLSWDELSIKLDEVLSTGPSDAMVNSNKTALVSAFKIYALKGKALSSAQSNLQQIARDIYAQQRQKDLIDDQAKRLNDLQTNLNPAKIQDLDKSKVDLIGLTGSLSVIRSQMLGILSKAFTTQDLALQYTYMQLPTVISSFDTLGIKGALVAQKNNTIAAETALNQCQSTTTTPIDIVFEVSVEDLKKGGVYQFNLSPNQSEFFQYVNTRVESVVAKIDGLKSSDKQQKYLLELAYNGRPFLDRAIDRDIAVFNTLRRARTYEYILDGNQPKFVDNGKSWSENVNPVTPFSIWEVSLPDTKTNKGLTFEGPTAKITLSFVLNARIHDVRSRLMRRSPMLMAMASGNAFLPVKPPVESLLGQMNGKTVLNNWDVVFNMALDKINDTLQKQYNELKMNDQVYGGKISIDGQKTPETKIGDIQQYSLRSYHMSYGYPLLNFLINNDNTGKLEMQITSGTVQKGTRYEGENTELDRSFLIMLARQAGKQESDVKEEVISGKTMLVFEFYNDPITIGSKASLIALIKISQVKGLVKDNQNILSVVLEMSKGSFTANNIDIEMSDEQKVAFSDAVKAYFVNHSVTFIINSLDLTGIATLPDLKPNQFLFKAMQSQAGNQMLQLFIQTGNRETFNYSQTFINSDVSDPIPEGSDCSLMINSRIFFDKILPSSITSGWTIAGVKPVLPSQAWSGIFTNASVQGNVDLSSLNRTYTPPSGGTFVTTTSTTYYTYVPTYGNPVNWSLNGMIINPNKDGMMMAYKATNKFAFSEKSDTVVYVLFSAPKHYYGSSDLSTDIGMSILAPLPIVTDDSSIKINVSPADVGIDARTSGGGPCGSTDLQAQVNNQLKSSLPDQIKSKLNINFNNVSVFALKNLMFPSNNRLKLNCVHVPGDLLILGEFTTAPSA